jgi:hypothetical protein
MSFFCDFLHELSVDDVSNKIVISVIMGVGVGIVGKMKINNLAENEIIVEANKKKIDIVGENLTIKSIAKGEIFVLGNITKIETIEGV